MAASRPNYIPRADAEFDTWQNGFASPAADFLINNLISEDLALRLLNAQILWQATYAQHVQKQAAAEAATQQKDEARAAYESLAREAARAIQGFPTVTDADRASMGLTVRASGRTPTPTPTSAPIARVDTALRLRHTIRFTDAATPTRRAKPKGTLGAELRLKLVDAGTPTPTDPSALQFLSLSTDGTATAEFEVKDGGKTAVYMLRWISAGGVAGPWSEPVSATVAA
ncbi:MAG: hypothetical protein KF691_02390 [Phycisphaeraceae bacterium]|nr:hypothetical protein [Phycisphaeraceae bacterium]